MTARLPPESIIWALSRHNAYLTSRPGGERLQRRGGDFADLKLDGANLDDAILPGCSFAGASLKSAQFARADLFSRSEEHTSELQSLMRISYAVFCFEKNK